MKQFTYLLCDRDRTVVTHYLCESIDEHKKTMKFVELFNNSESDLGWIYNNVEYYSCIKTFTIGFDEQEE